MDEQPNGPGFDHPIGVKLGTVAVYSKNPVPCPFCTNKDIRILSRQPYITGEGIYGGVQLLWVIRCTQCKVEIWGDTKRGCIEAWERRGRGGP